MSSNKAADCPPAETKKKAPVQWTLHPHICRYCFGRILRAEQEGSPLWRCSHCGREETGPDVSCLCCCGIKYKRGGRKGMKSAAPVDAGIRCITNPMPTPEFPAEIVASEVGHVSAH